MANFLFFALVQVDETLTKLSPSSASNLALFIVQGIPIVFNISTHSKAHSLMTSTVQEIKKQYKFYEQELFFLEQNSHKEFE